jgi:hypothetical protein
MNQQPVGTIPFGQKVVTAQAKRIDLALVQSVAVLLSSFAQCQQCQTFTNADGSFSTYWIGKLDTGHVGF